ncbi:hypothetical protein BpHYR1_017070 [Brachionus plicatilis]|uniref:Uncharacterized protein n=1 Tax=Brachionus plicatilis TaxID=10195 RepID=A0A3M7RQ61_BRAPC|nr:hypothetical protein BpHYR1_017070 [Brachionus plicatilis]
MNLFLTLVFFGIKTRKKGKCAYKCINSKTLNLNPNFILFLAINLKKSIYYSYVRVKNSRHPAFTLSLLVKCYFKGSESLSASVVYYPLKIPERPVFELLYMVSTSDGD